MREVADRATEDAIFFVEDTSLRIEALSTPEKDKPGLAVKEWFPNTSFEGLDAQLRSRRNDRGATIKSDIALHLPGLSDPLFFHGETQGVVADHPMASRGLEGYPWLGPNSFNGWFVPDGTDRPLGEMDVETSLEHDFRARALVQLLDRLEEYAAILNLPPLGYRRRQRVQVSEQESLFASPSHPLLVLGRTCAGKTTFANYAFHAFGLRHIEASSIVRMSHRREAGSGSGALTAAQDLLSDFGPAFVAQQVLTLFAIDEDRNLVLTGFRTIEEILTFCRGYPDTVVIWVEALERTRYERHLRRGRYPEAGSLASFRELDEGQMSLGLLRNGKELADFVLDNEESVAEYYRSIEILLSGARPEAIPGLTTLPSFERRAAKSQLYRILRAMAGKSDITSREVSPLTAQTGRVIATRNVNEVLKHFPELAKRFEPPGQEIRYQATPAGIAYVEFMDARRQHPQRVLPVAKKLPSVEARVDANR